jgi:hypothetical protein
MTPEEAKVFEDWLMQVYQLNNSVPFYVLAEVLRTVRAKANVR